MTKPDNTEDELIEKLAAIEHERWADWQKWIHTSFYKVEKGNAIHQALPQLLIERWERQINTDYANLSEAEKQSDRDQVMRYWPLIKSNYISKADIRAAIGDAQSRYDYEDGAEVAGNVADQIRQRLNIEERTEDAS